MTIENLTDSWRREATIAAEHSRDPKTSNFIAFKTVLQKDVSIILKLPRRAQFLFFINLPHDWSFPTQTCKFPGRGMIQTPDGHWDNSVKKRGQTSKRLDFRLGLDFTRVYRRKDRNRIRAPR